MVFHAILRQILNYWLCAISLSEFLSVLFPTMLQRYSLVGRLVILRMRWRNFGLLSIYGVPESQSPRVYKGVPEAEAWPDTAKLPPQTLPSMGGGHIHRSPSDFRRLVSLGLGESDHALPKPTEGKSKMF